MTVTTDTGETRNTADTAVFGVRPSEDKAVSGVLRRGDELGRYRVESFVGRGGMGEVYRAYDPELDRSVALKVIQWHASVGADAVAARARLLREAKRLARISHPNVIAVYDAGTIGEDVYVAMELVEGANMRGWLAAEPRSQQQILSVFRDAAAGLAAAHDAGLVHRDVKPENLLIGEDERVRLIDFGIAQVAQDDPPEFDTPGETPSTKHAHPRRETSRFGTPAYMAPEQRSGSVADARSDQYSLAITLLEALTGWKPEARGHSPDIADLVADADFPGWLGVSLERGLSLMPADRYDSMTEFAEALTAPRKQRPIGLWIGIGTAIAIAASWVLFAAIGADTDDPCDRTGAELSAVWNPDLRDATRQAFASAAPKLAATAFEKTGQRLDRYADEWSAARSALCREARAGEVATADEDTRRNCLGQRLGEMRAVVTVLGVADKGTVENGARMAAGLTPIASCTNLTRLAGEVALGTEIDEAVANIKAFERAGKYKQGLAAAEALRDRAVELDSPPAQARALVWTGRLQSQLYRSDAAAETLFSAVRSAELAGDNYARAEAWTYLIYVVGVTQRKRTDAMRWSEQAEVAIRAAGSPLELEDKRLYHTALVLRGLQRYDEALTTFRRSTLLAERAFGAGSYELLLSKLGIAMSLRSLERLPEAIELYDEVLTGLVDELGTDNPRLAIVHANIAMALSAVRRYDEAREHYVRSRELKVAKYGPDHKTVQITDHNMAVLDERLGDYEAAERGLEAVHQARVKRDGPNYRKLAMSLEGRGRVARKRGDLLRAATLQRESFEAYRAKGEDAREDAAYVRASLCNTLRLLGQIAEARSECAAAVATLETRAGDPRNLASALTVAAHVELDAGRPAAARKFADRAQAIRDQHPSEPADQVRTWFVLASAMAAQPAERAAALELAKKVRQQIDTLHVGDQELEQPASQLVRELEKASRDR